MRVYTIKTFICTVCSGIYQGKKTTRNNVCPECKPIKIREYKYKYKYQGKCLVCGRPCHTGARRCLSCRTEAGRIACICPKCNGIKSFQSKLCRKCSIEDRKNNPQLRTGGRYKEHTGYVMAYAPTHPRVVNANKKSSKGRRQHIAEHILVWEQIHNKPLPNGWIIHHLNGIRDDNRPENLVAMRKKDHHGWTYVKALQARIRELEQLHLSI